MSVRFAVVLSATSGSPFIADRKAKSGSVSGYLTHTISLDLKGKSNNKGGLSQRIQRQSFKDFEHIRKGKSIYATGRTFNDTLIIIILHNPPLLSEYQMLANLY